MKMIWNGIKEIINTKANMTLHINQITHNKINNDPKHYK